jgi:hypothetical protein
VTHVQPQISSAPYTFVGPGSAPCRLLFCLTLLPIQHLQVREKHPLHRSPPSRVSPALEIGPQVALPRRPASTELRPPLLLSPLGPLQKNLEASLIPRPPPGIFQKVTIESVLSASVNQNMYSDWGPIQTSQKSYTYIHLCIYLCMYIYTLLLDVVLS